MNIEKLREEIEYYWGLSDDPYLWIWNLQARNVSRIKEIQYELQPTTETELLNKTYELLNSIQTDLADPDNRELVLFAEVVNNGDPNKWSDLSVDDQYASLGLLINMALQFILRGNVFSEYTCWIHFIAIYIQTSNLTQSIEDKSLPVGNTWKRCFKGEK